MKIFFSYTHVDEQFCDMLQKHLAALKHQGLIETWHDRRIRAGDEFDNVIDRQLNEAQVILLLVSSDFIASRYCYEIEMARSLERHRAGEARVIPVILRPCDWKETPFGKLMAAPKDGKPIKAWPDIDEAFLDVVKRIREVISDQRKNKVISDSPSRPVLAEATIVDRPRSGNLTIRKGFKEVDREDFLISSYGYIFAYFQNSLTELEERNPELSTRFRKTDENRFTAVIYRNGDAVGRCKISFTTVFGHSIGFSYNDQAADNSYNQSLSVEADDQHMFFRPMNSHMGRGDRKLTQEGAAELYWSLLIQQLQ